MLDTAPARCDFNQVCARRALSPVLIVLAVGVYLFGLHLVEAWPTPIACCLAVLGLAWLPAAPRWSVKLGDICYGIRLWHWPVVMLLPWLVYWLRVDRASGELWRWELLGMTCALAWLSWTWLEQPINRWAARLVATWSKPRVDGSRTAAALVQDGELASRPSAG